jgi:GTP-binding protein Era
LAGAWHACAPGAIDSGMAFKSGVVAIVGRPNAGKSTLVNTVVGRKVAIVSPRPQTTRNRIQGILNRENAQIILIDTPGIHKPDNILSHQMMGETEQATEGVDIISLIVDVTSEFGPGDRYSAQWLKRFRIPVFLLLNKIDRVSKPMLLPLIDHWRQKFEFAEIFPISALTGEGCAALVESWIAKLPEAPAHFPDDQYTDQPERFLVSELIREQALRITREEVPHAIAVFIDRFEERESLIKVLATIYVEREGQKGILIGKGGETIKRIGTLARKEIEVMLGVHVFLELMVKVQPNWRRNRGIVRQLDWRRQLEQMSAGAELDEDATEEESDIEPES